MDPIQATGLRTGALKGLPLLAALCSAVAVAAWVWPVGVQPSIAPVPAAGAGAQAHAALAVPDAALRSPPAPPASDRAAAARATSRREANDAARAPSPDSRARARESEHYERFLALAAQDPRALEAEAASVLDGTGPECEKVALLRALESGASPSLNAWLEHVILRLPERSDAAGDSVPSFALGMLERGALEDGAARETLERVAFGAPHAHDRLRRVAASCFAAHATEQELWRLAANLARERDALLRDSVLEALSRNCNASAVATVFGREHDGRRPEPAGTAQE